MFRVRKIKDPLHGYIYLSEMENKFIQQPVMLRLHDVRQNGPAYLTYPAAHGKRFAHSLGAMHVGGLMFLRAWDRGEQDARACLTENVKQLLGNTSHSIDKLRGRMRGGRDGNAVSGDGLYRHHDLINIEDDGVVAKLLCFQAIRLACLVHDVGHPPFSHTVETGLIQGTHSDSYPGHEDVGLWVVNKMVGSLEEQWQELGDCVMKIVEALVTKCDSGSCKTWVNLPRTHFGVTSMPIV